MRTHLSVPITLLLTTACYPAIAHPTRVGSGFSVITTLGMNVAEDDGVLVTAPPPKRVAMPTFGLNAALSIRDTSSLDAGPGLRLSVGTGFAVPIWQVYLELPRDQFGALDAGLGVALHGARPRLVMPYAQVGQQIGASRRFWFTQQGLAFGSTSRGRGSGPMWIPTVAMASGAPGGEASVFLTGIIGGSSAVHKEICIGCGPPSRIVRRNMLLVGVSWGQIVISNLPMPRDR
jgi:hypothetical protein